MSWLSWARMTRGLRLASRGTPRCSRPVTGLRRSAGSPRVSRRSRPESPCSTMSFALRPTNPRGPGPGAQRGAAPRRVRTHRGASGWPVRGPPWLDPVGAVDILLTLGGPATYRALVVDYGWPHDRFVDWLAATLSSSSCLTVTPPARHWQAYLPASLPVRARRQSAPAPCLSSAATPMGCIGAGPFIVRPVIPSWS